MMLEAYLSPHSSHKIYKNVYLGSFSIWHQSDDSVCAAMVNYVFSSAEKCSDGKQSTAPNVDRGLTQLSTWWYRGAIFVFTNACGVLVHMFASVYHCAPNKKMFFAPPLDYDVHTDPPPAHPHS